MMYERKVYSIRMRLESNHYCPTLELTEAGYGGARLDYGCESRALIDWTPEEQARQVREHIAPEAVEYRRCVALDLARCVNKARRIMGWKPYPMSKLPVKRKAKPKRKKAAKKAKKAKKKARR